MDDVGLGRVSQGVAGAAIERPQRGGVVYCPAGNSRAGGGFPPCRERRAVKRVGVMVCWGDGVLGG